jgi:hypothetical protein
MRKLLLFIMLLVCLSGCSLIGSFGTVKSDLDKPEFQAKLQPERVIRFLILSPDGSKDEGMERLIERTSPIFEEQFGIRFKIVGYREYKKPGTAIVPRPDRMLAAMYSATKNDPKSFDIAITGQGACALDFASLIIPVPTYLALIDDRYRRYVIVRAYDKWALAHEVAHAFVFNRVHGQCLLGTGFYPAGSSCYWLDKETWEEAMSNKFRDFSVKPNIPKENVSDDIEEK